MEKSKNDQGIQFRRKLKYIYYSLVNGLYHSLRYIRNANCNYYRSQESLLNIITLHYHVIEKCLTMTNFELGHGKRQMMLLCGDMVQYQQLQYDLSDIRYISALQAIEEYYRVHIESNYNLGEEVVKQIQLTLKDQEFSLHDQQSSTREDFFSYTNSPFNEFALSRHSVRAYSEEPISREIIEECVDLARTTPTPCNRQPNKTYVVSDKKLIKEISTLQGGGIGFVEFADKLLVLTSKVNVFNIQEQKEVFKSGGMYAMNLLYALHYYKIGACSLEWPDNITKDKKLRALLNIPDSEEIIIIISIGHPKNEFKYVTSQRDSLNKSLVFL